MAPTDCLLSALEIWFSENRFIAGRHGHGQFTLQTKSNMATSRDLLEALILLLQKEEEQPSYHAPNGLPPSDAYGEDTIKLFQDFAVLTANQDEFFIFERNEGLLQLRICNRDPLRNRSNTIPNSNDYLDDRDILIACGPDVLAIIQLTLEHT